MKKLVIDLEKFDSDYIVEQILSSIPATCDFYLEGSKNSDGLKAKLLNLKDEIRELHIFENGKNKPASEIDQVKVDKLVASAEWHAERIQEWENAKEYLLEIGCTERQKQPTSNKSKLLQDILKSK